MDFLALYNELVRGDSMAIEIKTLTALPELAQVIEVQKAVWQSPATTIAESLYWSFVKNGGSVIGAFDGARVIGFVLGFIGLSDTASGKPARENLKLVSQRMAILPEYRHQGVGYRLKLAQRDYALQQDLDLITWTFDPLVSRNAHLNIRKLGGISHTYLVDYYGTHSPMGLMGSTDRLLIEWWIKAPHTLDRLAMKNSLKNFDAYMLEALVLNSCPIGSHGFPTPPETPLAAESESVLLEIPYDFNAIFDHAPDLAHQWRQHSRALFNALFEAGYAVHDFVSSTTEGMARSYYVLERSR